MFVTPTLIFFGSTLVLLVLLFIVTKERQRGRRFFAVGFRGWLDKVVIKVEVWLVRTWNHFSKYIVQLNWYYSIHSVLRTFLRMIVAVYSYFETVFENNRSRTKQLRLEKRQLAENNHLKQIAEHQKDTALTPSQQQKLRKSKLEERF